MRCSHLKGGICPDSLRKCLCFQEKKNIYVSCGCVSRKNHFCLLKKKNDKEKKYFDGTCELFLRIQQHGNGVLFGFFIICLSCYAVIVLFTYLKEINL